MCGIEDSADGADHTSGRYWDDSLLLTEAGITNFYSGGADGVDCWASLSVLELRKRIPALRLYMLLPHEG